jgi:hypothetical protein
VPLSVELVNILLICAYPDTLDVVFSFIALNIVAQFDDFVCQSLRSESFKALIEPKFTKKVLIISRTTSKKCEASELSDAWNKKDSCLFPMKVTFSSRTLVNKALYTFYKVNRIIFTSTVFYFAPFGVLLFSTAFPIAVRSAVGHCQPLP